MFPQSEELWGLLKQVRKEGFLPYLVLVPDPLGPLAGHPHDPIHSQFEPAHMDQFIEMVHRLAFILKNIIGAWNLFRFRLGWNVSEGMSVWSGQSGREFEKLLEFDKAFDLHDRFVIRFCTINV